MSTQTKMYIALFGVALGLWLSYRLAISRTADVVAQYDTLNTEMALYKNLPRQRSLLEGKNRYYDSILRQMNLEDTSVGNNLVKVLAQESQKNRLKVIDFNEPHIYSDAGSSLYTYYFSLQGNFTDLLRTIYELEQTNRFGKVVHMAFEKKRNHRTRKNELTVTVFLQQLR